jgi:DNA transposition AAA+ family ATPase
MRSKIVPVSNVARLSAASEALLNRDPGMPGMGLIYGNTGLGKTTAVTWLITRNNGVYVRALASSTPSSILRTIARELDIEPRGSNVETVEAIVQRLAETGRPLFVDEADYLVDQKRLVETLRDIHDLATVPVVLIGMEGIQRRIKSRLQLTGRIAQWVEFHPATLGDLQLLAQQLVDVAIAPELLRQLHESSNGSMRLAVVGLGHIEALAKAKGLERVGLDDWTKGKAFFFGEAPRRAA